VTVINLVNYGRGVDLAMGTIIAECEANGIISHVAILAKNVNSVNCGDELLVYHMGPPLTRSLRPISSEVEDNAALWSEIEDGGDEASDEVGVNAAAFLEDLSENERRQMRFWFRLISPLFPEVSNPARRLRREDIANYHYIAHPPIHEERCPVTGRLKNLWLSCAGFVIYLYEKSKVVKKLLVPYSKQFFPTVDLDTIHAAGFRLPSKIMSHIGLSGDGPWPVVMPGYVVNAFNRKDEDIRNIPYFPREEDLHIA
jgi:hypothetical protein